VGSRGRAPVLGIEMLSSLNNRTASCMIGHQTTRSFTPRFREHGISYEPAQKPKSDLYRDMLPLITAAS
jgi:hypothetical protein